MINQTIWECLTTESGMNAVESIIGEPLTNFCVPRNSYINRVLEMEQESGKRLIVKFYRPGRWSKDMIFGEHAFLMDCFENELPVIPPLTYSDKTLFSLGPIFFAIFPKKGGRSIDELDEDLWKETGRLLARVHAIGATKTSSERITWRPSIATQSHVDTLIKLDIIPLEYQQPFSNAVTQFIEQTDPLFNSTDFHLIHGDCHFGNIIYRMDEHLYLVDFDDCVIGPAVQDLWMLLPDTVEHCQKELAWFIEGYSTFKDFSHSSLELIPALKTMRQIHFAAWCAIQSEEAHFHHHFPEWGSLQYWNELIKDIYAQ